MAKKRKKKIGSKIILIILLILGLTYLYSRYIGTTGLIVKEYSIVNNKIPDSFNGFKIVHFSDIHYGTTIKTSELNKMVNKINSLHPDIIIFTGDLIDHNYKITEKEKTEVIATLNKLNSNIGIYSIRGEHDITSIYNSIITQTNIMELNNINKYLYYKGTTPIILVGLDDYLNATQNYETAFNYQNENNSLYTILIAHEPDTLNKITNYNVDLMLSGHSHNGQIVIPFIGAVYTPEGAKTYYNNQYKINNTTLYISSGMGTANYKVRLFNRPSINFYRLYNK